MGVWYEDGWKDKPSLGELEILLLIAKEDGERSYSEIKESAGKEVGPFLRRLKSKGCVLQDEERDTYYLPHPLVGDYLTIKYGGRKD